MVRQVATIVELGFGVCARKKQQLKELVMG